MNTSKNNYKIKKIMKSSNQINLNHKKCLMSRIIIPIIRNKNININMIINKKIKAKILKIIKKESIKNRDYINFYLHKKSLIIVNFAQKINN